jgi:hypothetical protein
MMPNVRLCFGFPRVAETAHLQVRGETLRCHNAAPPLKTSIELQQFTNPLAQNEYQKEYEKGVPKGVL